MGLKITPESKMSLSINGSADPNLSNDSLLKILVSRGEDALFTLKFFQRGTATFETHLSVKRRGHKKDNIFLAEAKIPLDHDLLQKEERIFSLLPSEIPADFITFIYLGYGTFHHN